MTVDEIQVIGDSVFEERTRLALDALRMRAPAAHEVVCRNIGIIESVAHGSGMHADETPPRFVVGHATSRADTLWYAGVLVHDATHSALYRAYQAAPGGGVPREAWVGAEAESECLAAQRAVLVQLGAPDAMLVYFDQISSTDYYSRPLTNRWW